MGFQYILQLFTNTETVCCLVYISITSNSSIEIYGRIGVWNIGGGVLDCVLHIIFLHHSLAIDCMQQN